MRVAASMKKVLFPKKSPFIKNKQGLICFQAEKINSLFA